MPTKAHAIWAATPAGYLDPTKNLVKLSLVASPRLAGDGTDGAVLGDYAGLLDFPAQLRVFTSVNVLVDGAASPVTAAVMSPPPRSDLWKRLFRADSPVQLDGGGEVGDIAGAGTSVLHGPLTRALRAVYARPETNGAGPNGAAAAPGADPLGTALSGLAQWSFDSGVPGRPARAMAPVADAAVRDEVATLLDPTVATTATLDRAAELLRAQGLDAAAEVVPLVTVLQRLRGAPATGPAAAHRPAPGRLDSTRTADQADFHQVLGAVMAHPTLSLALGLRVDVSMTLPRGAHRLQVIGMPLQTAGCHPVTNVVADGTRFVMATQAGAPTEIVNGQLDLRAPGPAAAPAYVLTTMDVVGMTQALDAAARAGLPEGRAAALPARHDAGLTVAQTDRRHRIVTHTVARGTALSEAFGKPDSVPAASPGSDPDGTAGPVFAPGGEAELFADDVTAGYRIEVKRDGEPWRSLMRREITYRVGHPKDRANPPVTLTADDEGVVDAMVAVEQRDATGAPVLEIGEGLFTWDNYSLVVRRTGPVVGTVNGQVGAEVVPRTASTRFPLAMEPVVKKGTLPRLRFGSRYAVRILAVDLSGNSIDPSLCEPTRASEPVRFRRQAPVPCPVVVPTAPFTAGESLLRVVVRSDGAGNPLGGPCERHLAAPPASFELAELHGRFDAALSPTATPAAREGMLAVGALEAGSFLDATVPDPRDPTKRIPAPGVRVAVNADSPTPATGSLQGLRRGDRLPPGEYAVHATTDAFLPHLGDPLATGVAVAGFDATAGRAPVQVPFGGAFPSPLPFLFRVRPGTALAATSPTSPGGRKMFDLTVPAAATLTLQLSSTVDAAGLDVLEADLAEKAKPGALAGQVSMLTPALPVTVVHAVRTPLLPLAVTEVALGTRKRGATAVDFTFKGTCHPASTATVDVVARWEDTLDDGAGPVTVEKRTATAGSVTVTERGAELRASLRQSFGDTRRHDVTWSAVGSTRFREYFAVDTKPELLRREGGGVTAVVPNTGRPEALTVHATLPVFGWIRSVANGVLTSTRVTRGVRVLLDRPWHTTGPDERLGVVVYRDQAAGEQGRTRASHEQVSRWFGDSCDGFGSVAPHLTVAEFPGHAETAVDLPRPGQAVVGFPVQFDEAADRWYADVDFDLGSQLRWFPFLRLAVVRYQPASAPGCHVSPTVVTVPVQLPAQRTLIARARGTDQLDVTITGPWVNSIAFETTLYDRAAGATDVLVEARSPHGSRHMLSTPPFTNDISVSGTVPLRRSEGGIADLLVCRELQIGDSLHDEGEPLVTQPGGPANRTVWLETVDLAALGLRG